MTSRRPRPKPGKPLTLSDQILNSRLQELDSAYQSRVRCAAESWASGLKALLGLASTIGLLAAPFSVEHLTQRSQRTVGVLLLLVFGSGVVGLFLTMSAAYGTLKLSDRPTTTAELDHLIRSRAEVYLTLRDRCPGFSDHMWRVPVVGCW